MITYERLHDVLRYDPETGVFRWRVQKANVAAGRIAGKSLPTGYIVIRIDRAPYYAHRLAWFYMTGDWPPHQIDHIDGINNNNCWSNLRPATQSQNNANSRTRTRNKSGYKGVCPALRKWAAFIKISKKNVYLGTFETPELASAAYMAKARELFGPFARAR